MKRRVFVLLLLVLGALVITGTVYAMASANYRIDWDGLMAGSGGPRVASANAAVEITAGQSASGAASSANYRVQMGYWSAFPLEQVVLPVVRKN